MFFSNDLYNLCKRNVVRLILFVCFIITSLFSFSQQNTAADTTAYDSGEYEDSNETIDTTGDYLDSVNQAEHNFYNDTSYWPTDRLIIRKVPDAAVEELKQQDAFWYANKDFKKESEPDSRGNVFDWLGSKRWFRALAWFIIIAGFTTVLIWFLAGSNVRLFQRRSIKLDDNSEFQPEENIFDINYQKEIEKATREENYRLAVRLMFLRALKSLAQKNAIQYRQEQTNLDYLMQLHSTGYYKDFFRLTRHYEYAWYGQFIISNTSFGIIKKEFENFDRQFY